MATTTTHQQHRDNPIEGRTDSDMARHIDNRNEMRTMGWVVVALVIVAALTYAGYEWYQRNAAAVTPPAQSDTLAGSTTEGGNGSATPAVPQP